mmetsp:Transcript_574/g.810  ORF Transcript_574/g.810 Transcript_574/m.810 type:complete len:206 (-) Transcript_574:25-642(-)
MASLDQFKQLKLRPWDDFLDTKRFKLPEDANKLWARLITNMNYYAINYLSIGLIFLLLAMFFRPLLAIVVFLGAIGIVGLVSQRHTLAEKQFLGIVGGIIAVAVLLCIFLGGIITMVLFSIFGTLVLAHSSLRCRSNKSKIAARMNDLSPDEASHTFGILSKELSTIKSAVEHGDSVLKRPSVEAAKEKYGEIASNMKRKYDLEV